ncbi:Siderophore iron transporter 3 OS=Schizosaccharomyces pombe (strain 972 / ATCC 24843) GN=str3 PE=1 SV=1 [Rhizoctonia solani AG-1 IB]|uniref:Siderophore iron transporter 3 n=2 Tax=Thanatephorus cucumeris (strain AG1-IB / isolate 7/3/14) TaxID=1108050 RepID=A0A0B7FWS2_THACB|nr:Siderophore iron transporter 3 OS=Schizosaccharomyces pombe (strain 972 / ATCC 24843) GN=str3 PE=1 SV=1 [Rhizoctonia solani AG-1 IB]
MAPERKDTSTSSSDDKSEDKPVVSSPVSDPQTVRIHLGDEYERNPGVARVEALHRHLNRTWKWILYISIGALSYIYSLDTDTTPSYLPLATSEFGKHSFIGTIGTADGIITAVGKPCIAKIADLWSRPVAYSVVLVFYIIGYILVASARTVYAVAGGMIMYTVGHTGLFLVTDIIVSDISPLDWRGFAAGLTSAPVILNSFIAAEIVSSVEAGPGWRWGYGMFAVITPAIMAPAIITLFAAERRAKKKGELVSGRPTGEPKPRRSALRLLGEFTTQMDIVGLILVGLIFGLILFPISLAKTVHGGWSNASMIALTVVGVACIPVFIIWERFFATHAIMSKRLIMNRAFQAAVGIHFFHQFADPFWNLYLSSFVWVVKDWDTRSWVYFNNTVNVTTSVFNLIGGLILKYTHRYKYLQACGLGIRLIGIGLLISPHAGGTVISTVPLVWSQVLIGIGGAFSVVGSRVGAQASVPHEDLASLTALLSVWTSLGGSVGSAVATAIWTAKMPSNLDKYLPDVPQATINKLYGSIKSARNASPAVRQGVIQAYGATTRPMFIISLGLSCICFILAFFMPNYYLGKTQNAVDGKDLSGEVVINPINGEKSGRSNGNEGRDNRSLPRAEF